MGWTCSYDEEDKSIHNGGEKIAIWKTKDEMEV